MAYQALYRKYRPTVFSDVVGQEHITEILKQEIISSKLSHAYLFTGTRGTGKTTCAKILAKAINCQNPIDGNPCGECEMCRGMADGEITDIVEIDAASNNNVDSIREIRDQIAFPPAAAKYRVYIIDEVHMLSISAFNALLKTLEEPPSYVVFILATTEVHKLPATILSRCQRFDFRRIEPSRICERIAEVAKKEGFTVTDNAARLIASIADGGMRDALSILDMCASSNTEIDEQTVENSCAMAGSEYLVKMADLIKNRLTDDALLLVDELHNSSVDMQRLLAELILHYRNLMIAKTVKGDKKPIVCSMAQLKIFEEQAQKYDIREIIDILTVLQETAAKMPFGNRRCEMEMAVIRLCNPEVFTDITALERRVSALEMGKNAFVKPEISGATSEETKETSNTAEFKGNNTTNDFNEEDIPLPEPPCDDTLEQESVKADEKTLEAGITPVLNWKDILLKLQVSCPLIAGVLKGSAAYIKGDFLLIDAKNTQFKTMVNGENSIYRNQIRKAAAEVLGKTYKLGPFKKATEAVAADPLAAFAKKLENFEK
ncbi:MAG: DNA polymerase III subunit gamma/tau [Oscillospiraceae bacterium]|nr:DNA polymerase III subunit gamma/tau [Oscillospiraceae bacterium]